MAHMFAYEISRLTLFGLAMFLAGAGMLVTGSLPGDKMDKVYSFMGGKPKSDNQPPIRLQLLVGGAFFLFIGLLLMGAFSSAASPN
jgi:hypothetical protein